MSRNTGMSGTCCAHWGERIGETRTASTQARYVLTAAAPLIDLIS